MNGIKTSNPLVRLAIVVASSFNYAGAFLLTAIWNLNPIYYIIIIFSLSVSIGAIMVDIRDAIVYTYVSMGVGIALATTIFMAPYIILQEPVFRVNMALMVFFGSTGKVVLIGLIVFFLGALLGCFIGEKSLE